MKAHEQTADRDEHPLMTALAHGLPITLLVDLVDSSGPRSVEMFTRETRTPDAARRASSGGVNARTA